MRLRSLLFISSLKMPAWNVHLSVALSLAMSAAPMRRLWLNASVIPARSMNEVYLELVIVSRLANG